MNKTIIFSIMAALALTSVNFYMKSEQAGSRMLSSQQTLAQSVFTAWKMKHGKAYGSDSENSYRLQVFTENMKKVNEHNNKPGQTSTVGLNKFSDLPQDEFKKNYAKGLVKKNLKSTRNVTLFNTDNLAESVNWVTNGAVTDVKDQGQCGSCWAFSTTGSVEGANFNKSGVLQSFSEQQLVDCSTQNSGCNGGLMDYGFEYIQTSPLMLEKDYGYTASVGTCQYDQSKTHGTVTAFTDVTPDSTGDQLKAALMTGPVSVAIEADQYAFQGYTGGVITSGCGSNLDHGVLAVGYGTDDNGQEYFLVKNSWASTWGVDGYVKIAPSQCGITNQPSYPTA